MKKLIFILFVFISFIGFTQEGEDINVNLMKLDKMIYGTKSGSIDTLAAINLDSVGQFKVKNISDPIEPLDAVNLRYYDANLSGIDSLWFNINTGYWLGYAGTTFIDSFANDGRYLLLTSLPDSIPYSTSDGYLRLYDESDVLLDSAQIDDITLRIDNDGLVTHTGTLQEHLAHGASPYIAEGGDITNNGDGTITVDSCEIFIKTSNAVDGFLKYYVVPEAILTPIDEAVNSIYIDYNSGTPIYKTRQSTAGYFYLNWDELIFATVSRAGIRLHVGNYKEGGTVHDYKNVLKDANTGLVDFWYGLAPADEGTLHWSSTAGKVYLNNEPVDVATFNTTIAADTFTYYYYDGAAWVRTTGQSTLNNVQWNNTASGLVTLANNKFTNNYIYVIINQPNSWHVVYGQEEYANITDASAAGTPALLPPELTAFSPAAIKFKFISEKSIVAFTEIQDYSITAATSVSGSAADFQNLIDGGKVGNLQTINIENGTGIDVDVSDTDRSILVTNGGDSLVTQDGIYDFIIGQGYLTTEVDPVFAADSINILHWSDTLTTIATKGDVAAISNPTLQQVTDNDSVTTNKIFTGGLDVKVATDEHLSVESGTGEVLLRGETDAGAEQDISIEGVTVKLITNGLTAQEIQNDGDAIFNYNVGIGTSVLGAKLEIKGTSSAPLATIQGGAVFRVNTETVTGIDFGSSSATGFGWIQAKRTNAPSTYYDISLNPLGGNVGFQTIYPTAKAHIAAGTATAGTAPLKFTSGTNMTTGESGVMEYDGTELYFTPSGTTRETIAYISDITTATGDYLPLVDVGDSIIANEGNITITESQISDLHQHIYNETLTGIIDGVNAIFTLANTPITGTTQVILNGIRQTLTLMYTESTNTIVFEAAYLPQTSDVLRIDYIY